VIAAVGDEAEHREGLRIVAARRHQRGEPVGRGLQPAAEQRLDRVAHRRRGLERAQVPAVGRENLRVMDQAWAR
jgi:hypothetical protein